MARPDLERQGVVAARVCIPLPSLTFWVLELIIERVGYLGEVEKQMKKKGEGSA